MSSVDVIACPRVAIYSRVVDSFLSEAALEKPKTVEQLNALFLVWLQECYQHKPHSALGGRSPEETYRTETKTLRFVDPGVLANAFLHVEKRKVDKSGCISFLSRKYEVGLVFIGCTVDVIYDPQDVTELTIEYLGHTPWQVKELSIGERVGKRPLLPEHMTIQPTSSSRLLSAASTRNQSRQARVIPDVSYRAVRQLPHVWGSE